MSYKRKKGGYKYRQHVGNGKTAARKQRIIIQRIIEQAPSREELYQYLTAITLLSSKITDAFDELETYRKD